MPQLQRVSTAVPEHQVNARETREFVRRHLDARRGARIMQMLDASCNHSRYVVRPLGELEQLASIDERNQAYREHAIALAESVARRALDGSGMQERIGTLVCVSSTGFMVPALPAFLIDRLGLRPTCRGVALSQLGCAGGVAALGMAADLVGQVGGEDAALVVSVEIPSLSLQIGAPSLTDIVAATQFGDGAAAALLSHSPSDEGLEIVATHRIHFTGTHAVDGVRLTATGLRLLRQDGIPQIIRTSLRPALTAFLDRHGLLPTDVAFWVAHPRTPQILDAIRESVRLREADVACSQRVWEEHGNMISAAVFFVLRELFAQTKPPAGPGVMLALGAGLTCEMLLLRTSCSPPAFS